MNYIEPRSGGRDMQNKELSSESTLAKQAI